MAKLDKLTEYYNKFNEDKRLISRHGQVEYRVSMKYIHRYLEKIGQDARILDVGAATGAYSIPLADEGYEVHAIELVKHNVARLKAKSDKVHALQGNALKLSRKFEKDYFDLVLIFGPMYHLYSQEDRLKVIQEAKQVTKNGGIIMIAYCMNDYAVVLHGFVDNNIVQSVNNGKLNEKFKVVATQEDLYDYVTLEQIDELANQSGLERELIFTPDGPANYIRPALKSMSEEAYELFVKYVESIAERADLLGAAAHTVDVLIKKE